MFPVVTVAESDSEGRKAPTSIPSSDEQSMSSSQFRAALAANEDTVGEGSSSSESVSASSPSTK